MSNKEGEHQHQLLGVVVDAHPRQLSALSGDVNLFLQCMDGVMAFCNSYLVMSAKNKLVVLAADASHCQFLYTGEQVTTAGSSGKEDGQYELLSLVNSSIKTAIREMYRGPAQEEMVQPESLVPAALTKALCYFNRCEKELPPGETMVSRILLVTASCDSMLQYMAYMNAFFTAQKMGVMIDCCMLGEGSGLIQQGCDITGGIYLKIPQPTGLLQYLLMVFLPDASVRDKLLLPPPVRVDYRAACFCHRNLVDIGYVCSVCLSIFCKFSPICSTCHTVFKHDKLPFPAKSKKRKLKT